jgi:hypothetical protein
MIDLLDLDVRATLRSIARPAWALGPGARRDPQRSHGSAMADRSVRSRRLDAAAGARGRPSRSQARTRDQLRRSAWEREMRRLRVIVRLLAVVLLALAARMVVSGINAVIGVTGGIVAGLLVAALLLTREGRRLEPNPRGKRDD